MSIVNILCAFIIACPIFDVMSYVFRNYMNTNFSISTFLRPIIPMCILAIIFLKGKKKEKNILVCSCSSVYSVWNYTFICN